MTEQRALSAPFSLFALVYRRPSSHTIWVGGDRGVAKKKRTKSIFPELPLSPQTVRATLVGRSKLFVENHSGLLEVKDSRVRVRTSFGEILITGMHLKMDTDGAGMLCITGAIAALSVDGGTEDA